MKTLLSGKLVTRRRVARAVAMLFLIYTALDITAPEFCKGEVLGDGGGRAAVLTSLQTASEALATAFTVGPAGKQPQNRLPEESSNDEDCFCCCTHILPGTITVSLETSDASFPGSTLEHLSTASPTLPSQFHPPRSV
jgi:hypothetical protein